MRPPLLLACQMAFCETPMASANFVSLPRRAAARLINSVTVMDRALTLEFVEVNTDHSRTLWTIIVHAAVYILYTFACYSYAAGAWLLSAVNKTSGENRHHEKEDYNHAR